MRFNSVSITPATLPFPTHEELKALADELGVDLEEWAELGRIIEAEYRTFDDTP